MHWRAGRRVTRSCIHLVNCRSLESGDYDASYHVVLFNSTSNLGYHKASLIACPALPQDQVHFLPDFSRSLMCFKGGFEGLLKLKRYLSTGGCSPRPC
jgi:hypothetical protein